MTRPDDPVDDSIFRRVVEQSRDYAVFVLDPQGNIRTWNQGAQRLKGYRPEEIIGRHFSVFYTRESVDSGWPAHELKMAAREGRFEDEGWRVRSDGSRFWANVIITALRDDEGHLIGFSKFTRDLTERRLYEEALRQSEERFRLLVDGVQDYAIYMLDTEGIVSSWNAGARRIKGYTREEIVGKHFSNFYTPEDIEAARPWEALAHAKSEGHFESEGWRMRKDGTRFWARAVLTPLLDERGVLRGYAKVTQDLSERRQLRALEKAAQNVNEFIAMLAHELRNPLAPIRTAVKVMSHAQIDAPAQEQLRQTIDRQSANLVRIVDDLVDISRITRGVLDLERSPADLAEIVRHAIDTVVPAIEARRHTLEVTAPPMPVMVVVDRHRMNQVLVNLLTNAARYTPEGGSIGVAVQVEGGVASVRVKDNGRGIEPEMQGRIFDMFVQGRSPIERVSGGLGVGLALARRLVEAHGGTLEVRSEGRDRGSEFVVRLEMPRRATLGDPRPEDAGPALEPGTKAGASLRRVLVVDDNADAAQTLEMLLKSLGHEVQVANDGRQALEAASQFRPDIVLLDIGMPGMSGYEVARRLRSLEPPGRPVRIVAVTGWGQDLDRQQSREAGFDVHLVKPVDIHQLESVLAERNGARIH
ncbi:MAG TPA: PAS domain S-box protein [Usitatibacter sp.]|nr:PAS domain S-box protein [Usitatibacter sp.]